MSQVRTIFTAVEEHTESLFGPARRDIAWSAETISGTVHLALSETGFVRVVAGEPADPGAPAVVPCARPHNRTPCFLVTPPSAEVLVNGQRPASITALNNGDEIALSGAVTGRAYFLGEAEAKVEPYQETEAPAKCPRSKTVLREGMPVVYCPGCGTPYLQSDDVPAFTYGAECVVCQRPSRLGLSWRPAPEVLPGAFDLARALGDAGEARQDAV